MVGIVTDASEWYFMECSLDNEGKPSFKLSEPVTVVYKDEKLEQLRVKKVKSSSNLIGNTNYK